MISENKKLQLFNGAERTHKKALNGSPRLHDLLHKIFTVTSDASRRYRISSYISYIYVILIIRPRTEKCIQSVKI